MTTRGAREQQREATVGQRDLDSAIICPRELMKRRLAHTVLLFLLGATYSDARGEFSHPGEWAHRKFLAYRGFGGPNCGVDVVVDSTAPSGMALGSVPAGVAPGQGDCSWYNPFSNAIEFSAQPGARFRDTRNPEFRPELALKLGERVDAQLAAHYERYQFADSFDPKAPIRVHHINWPGIKTSGIDWHLGGRRLMVRVC